MNTPIDLTEKNDYIVEESLAYRLEAYRALGFLSPREIVALEDILLGIVSVNHLDFYEYPFTKDYKNKLEVMEGINAFLQKYALRAGERTDIKPPKIDTYELAQLKNDFTNLGMVESISPEHLHYDAALCLGAAEAGVRPRIDRLAHIVNSSIFTIDNIAALGSSRKLWPLKKTEEGTEFPEPIVYDILAKRLSARDGKPVSADDVKSIVLNMDTKETTVEKLSEEVSSHPYFAGIAWPVEADLISAVLAENPVFSNQHIVVVNAPDYPNGKRADTARTIQTALDEHPEVFNSGATVLAISSQPFTRNQRKVIEQNLPKGTDVCVIGEGIKDFTPKQAMLCFDSLARTVYGALSHYKAKEKELLQAASLDHIKQNLHEI